MSKILNNFKAYRWLSSLALLSLVGCSTDVSLNAPYEETTVVYGLINQEESVHVFAGLSNEEREMARQYLGTICPVELGKISEEQLNDGSMCGVLEMLPTGWRNPQRKLALKRYEH